MTNEEFKNEYMISLEEQRNSALNLVAELKAKLNMTNRQLGLILQRIKERGLTEHFVNPPQDQAVVQAPTEQQKESQPLQSDSETVN